MGLHILRESALSQLRGNIEGNVGKYSLDEPWINEEFRNSRWTLDTHLARIIREHRKEIKTKALIV